MEKIAVVGTTQTAAHTRRSLLGTLFLLVLLACAVSFQLCGFSLHSRIASTAGHLHSATHRLDRDIDWSWLSHEKQCPSLEKIRTDEFTARRNRLAQLLTDKNGTEFGAYITEPSANTLYYLNVTQSNWYLSERPWLAVVTPSNPPTRDFSPQHQLSILVPTFEKSRSQKLPFAIDASEIDQVLWVTWDEAENPYDVLVKHLVQLRTENGYEGDWSIQIEENVRQFVATGLEQAALRVKSTTSLSPPSVGLAKLAVRELRVRKTRAELEIQRCVAKITLEALRAVRKHLRIGMTEKEGEALILNALKAGGLTDIGAIVLFGENAALPHASASTTKKLREGEFALFDVDGALFGYMSDFTRTMLPDRFSNGRGRKGPPVCEWPQDARSKTVFETVQRAQQAALDKLLTPNSTDIVYASQVDAVARAVIVREGFGRYFTHRLGHGIGLEVHEHPYLNSGNSEQVLQPGVTFSNEPGIYIEEQSEPTPASLRRPHGIGVRLEDMVLKTEGGWELISGMNLATSPCSP